MKRLFVIVATALSVPTFAADVTFKSLNVVRSAGTFHINCATTSGSPRVNFAYHNGSSALGNSASLAVTWTGEGLFVRDWSNNLTYPSWYVNPILSEPFSITGSLVPSGEYVKLTMEDSSSGRFKSQLTYSNQSGQSLTVNVRCNATNYFKTL
jgi:hypothetical protein